MDWVLEHIQLILVAAGSIAYWLNQRKREKAGEPADYDGDGIPENQRQNPTSTLSQNSDEEERTRQIQEEIRRRIAERRGDGQPPPRAVPPPLPEESYEEGPAVPTLAQQRRTEERANEPSPYAHADDRGADHERVLARQREITEQMAALVARRRATEDETNSWGRRSAATSAMSASAADARAAEAQNEHALMKDLRGAKNLRRAMVLREVLGPPVGLR